MSNLSAASLPCASAPDRNKTDFYPTPWEVTRAIANFLFLDGVRVWEPACGEGHMSRELERCGAIVTSTTLHDQGYGQTGVDFLTAEPPAGCEWIITNPPFALAQQFIERAIALGLPSAFLLKSQYWHSSRRLALFERHFPYAVLPLTWRPDFHFGAKGGSPTMECLWTVFHPQPSNVTRYVPLRRPTDTNDLFSNQPTDRPLCI
ncbi:conserved hypothetical protein [Hyphomicrobiales bacterium]|nr:conserved hypothetical protein [Hyphomicrobiales bacterium]CAH1671753.1 conserved hypothetical protein [Hyphomicrobiales bacterium]